MILSDINKYLWVNSILLVVIISIIAYSAVFDAGHHPYPVKSGADLFGNGMAMSKGLSRSFSEIVRLNFEKAEHYNPYGLRIFAFFAVQLLMRLLVMIMLLFGHLKQLQMLVFTDVMLSILLFTVFFWPFLLLTIKQFC